MNARWPTKPLGELVENGELPYGIVQPGNHIDSGVPIVRVKDLRSGRVNTTDPLRVDPSISERHQRTALRGGEVLISIVGTIGQSAVAPSSLAGWNVARAIAVVRPFNTPAKWVELCLQSPEAQDALFSRLNTTVQATLNLADLKRIPIPIPPAHERDAIIELMGALDDKMTSNHQAVLLTQELLKALHKQALTAGHPIAEPFFDVFDVDFGEAFKGDHFSEPRIGRPLIRIRDLKTSTPQVWTTEFRASEVIIHPGDVLVGMDAEFRATWWLGEPGLLNQRVCRVRGKQTGPAFVAESLRSPLREIENQKSGTTVIHLNKSDLVRSQVLVPPADLLAEFEEKSEPLVRSRVAIAVENRRLAHVRDQLLPLLMSGKVRVREAEKVVEGVV